MPDENKQRPFASEEVQKTCVICSREFCTKNLKQICCTPACSYERQKQIARDRYPKFREKNPWKSKAKKCVECGISFVLQIRQHNKKTCSISCRRLHLNKMSVGYRNRDRAEDPDFYYRVLREKKQQARLKKEAKEQLENEKKTKDSQ